jgi:hypothetical protein
MGWFKNLLGIKDPPSAYDQTLQGLKAKRQGNEWAFEDWNKRNPWYSQWQDYAADAAGTFGDYGDRFAQADAINNIYQQDTDSLYNQNIKPLLGSGVGSYESDQYGLFGQRSEAATKGTRAYNENLQDAFSSSLADMARGFGTATGGFGSGFAGALGSAFGQAASKGANMMGKAQQSIAQDRTNVYDKVNAAQQGATAKVDAHRQTALDSMLAPQETALAGWDSITSRQRQNAPQFA